MKRRILRVMAGAAILVLGGFSMLFFACTGNPGIWYETVSLNLDFQPER